MVPPFKAGDYLIIGNWSIDVLIGSRFVFGIIMRWEWREPFLSGAINTLENNNNNNAYFLSFAKVAPRACLIGRRSRGYSCVSA